MNVFFFLAEHEMFVRKEPVNLFYQRFSCVYAFLRLRFERAVVISNEAISTCPVFSLL